MDCDLCKRPQTKIEKECQDYWVAYCRNCNVLMAWSRAHIMPLEKDQRKVYDEMQEGLEEVADRVYGRGNYRLDFRQRSITDHMHIHARPIQ